VSNLLQHRGYSGSIEASTKDNCLFGKLLFIHALVNYEGETIAELQAAFREAVNDYMATCQELGR
jgi:predicted HicB family RNase H-like nuclease